MDELPDMVEQVRDYRQASWYQDGDWWLALCTNWPRRTAVACRARQTFWRLMAARVAQGRPRRRWLITWPVDQWPEALPRAIDALIENGLRDRIKVIASGKITPGQGGLGAGLRGGFCQFSPRLHVCTGLHSGFALPSK